MTSVMRIIGLVNGQPTKFDGEYVISYDPSPEGSGWEPDEVYLVTTPNIQEAKKYESSTDAMEEWRRIDKRHPVRQDGMPNRPFTAFTVEILPLVEIEVKWKTNA